MLQYKIPQNVGIEDKIVGPFSLRQLIIVAVGVGVSYVLFAIGNRLYELNVLEYIIIVLPALFALAAALIKVNNVTFTKYLLLVLEFAIKPKKRFWDHRGLSFFPAESLTDNKPSAKKVAESEKKQENVNLHRLSSLLDSGGFENVRSPSYKDIDEAEDEDLITEAFFGHKKKESPTENMYWRTREMQKKKLKILAGMPKKADNAAKETKKETKLELVPAAETGETEKQEAAAPPSEKANQIKSAPPETIDCQNAPAAEPEEEKPSVVENLAKVIHDANKRKQEAAEKHEESPRQENQTQKAAEKTESNENDQPVPKKRKRKRKPKAQAPARPEAAINTLHNQPAIRSEKPKPADETKREPVQSPEIKEFDLNELRKGEIEINLD